jgi:hypothetical protein
VAAADPKRGTPNPDRPRLPDADEARLAPLDQQGARAYTSIEVGLEMIRTLFGVETGGIPVLTAVTDTAVVRISAAAKQKLRGG